ncbi:hypothetical protein HGRIS_003549 [Hohenbuehelia grisea]|uniref:Cytochrome P450 n=1 Tax=Hohenbuehelia grisea TaxID=104357 RepID=A0ABR3JFU2_9AGAR
MNPFTHFLSIFAAPVAIARLQAHLSNGFLPMTTSGCLQFICVYVMTLVLSVSTYRLSPFHPLAQYPGPVLCKLSKLWMMYISSQGKQHIYYQALHRRYGDVVRIGKFEFIISNCRPCSGALAVNNTVNVAGPNELSIIDPSVMSPLYGQNELPKGPMWDGRLSGGQTRSLVAVRDLHEHARRRKPWARALGTAALKNYEPIMKQRAHELVERLERTDGRVDLAEFISFFAYDFMSDMAFGGGFDLLKNGDKNGFWRLLDSSVPTPTILGHAPWLSQYYARLPGKGTTMPEFRAFAYGCAQKRISEGSTAKDIFYYLNNEDGHEPVQPPLREVISGGTLVIVAGSDTTASALSNAFYMLLCNSTAYKRLRGEIDKHFAPGDDVSDVAKHLNMPYLNGVINESLRMFPPVPSGGQRANPHDAPTQILGSYAIPGGTSVITPIYVLHRDPRNFSEPETFMPERWMSPDLRAQLEPEIFSENKAASFVHEPTAFIPFSIGSSNCVGKSLAYQM